MLTFLFWNLGKQNLARNLAQLAISHNVDILILAECQLPVEEMVSSINHVLSVPLFEHIPIRLPSLVERISILSRYNRVEFESLSDDKRYTIRSIRVGKYSFILVAAHLHSQLVKENTREFHLRQLGKEIRRIEDEIGHRRTLLVGDLNANPFDEFIVSSEGLHAVMSRQIARKGSRPVDGEDVPYFYNPMWRFLSERDNQPQGTYYYCKGDPLCYFWHIFDQVIIRPFLFDVWDNESLQILTSDGKTSLLSRDGRPRGKAISDHLPILFRLKVGE